MNVFRLLTLSSFGVILVIQNDVMGSKIKN